MTSMLPIRSVTPALHDAGVPSYSVDSAFGPNMVPIFDLGPQPQLRSTTRSFDHRPWHVWVTTLIETHALALRQAKDLGNTLRIQQVIGVDKRRHEHSLRTLTGPIKISSLL